MEMPSFEKVAVIRDLIEAQVLESVLNERAVPFRLRSFHDTAYDGLYQFQQGWGEIYSPAERRQEILEVIQSIRQEASSTAPGPQ